jgi:hypothetical protein
VKDPLFYIFFVFKLEAMENLPIYVSILFVLTTLFALYIFYRATHRSRTFAIIITAWLIVQAALAIPGFYTVTWTVPPRFVLAIGPPLIAILLLFITKSGRQLIDRLDLRFLTIIHLVRIPVEIILFLLFIHQAIPALMTFEGRNFDILSGLSAPLIYYYAFRNHKTRKNVLIVWNFICIGLLVNIVTIAILSAPFTFQKLAFDQPNIGVFYFPFIWLPACIVPLVLFSHLASIRQLIKEKSSTARHEDPVRRPVPSNS